MGGGHNGLTAAAYLARAGKSVLVLERREQLGGACTLEQPFADDRYLMSPCAYLVGLLHPLVIEELDLARHGYRTFVVDPTQWTPFEDGTSLFQWHDDARTAAAVEALAPSDVEGFLAYEALFDRIRDRLRRGPLGDVWVGGAPDRAALEELFADDAEARDVVLDASIADVVEAHVKDGRLRAALHGQGCIGTFAGPREPGTAWIHAHHSLGLIGGWSFVEGGMGRVSFCLADAAREAGAVIAAGTPVAEILPGEGVVLEGGETIRARAVVSNADPVRTLALVGDAVSPALTREGGVVAHHQPRHQDQLCALAPPDLPCRRRRPHGVPRHRWRSAAASTRRRPRATPPTRGEPAPEWCELYFQTPYDASVAPPGSHTMSVFAQFVPYDLARGTWDERRDEIADATLAAIARFAPDVADCVVDRQVLGPPDVEEKIGLTGGHIFQGECLPDQMWDRRFAAAHRARRPLPLRRRDAPGRVGDGHQRPQRRRRRPRGSRPHVRPCGGRGSESIRDTIARYAHAADTGHFDALVECFAPDGVLELVGSDRVEGRAAIREYLGGVGRDLAGSTTVPYVRHHVSSTWITVSSAAEAVARSYFFVVTEHGPDHWGRYKDVLAPVDGRWRFTLRLVHTDGATPGGWGARFPTSRDRLAVAIDTTERAPASTECGPARAHPRRAVPAAPPGPLVPERHSLGRPLDCPPGSERRQSDGAVDAGVHQRDANSALIARGANERTRRRSSPTHAPSARRASSSANAR